MTNAEIKELMVKKAFTQVLSDEELKKLEDMSITDLIDNKYITDGSYFPNETVEEEPVEPVVEEPEVNEENPEVNPVVEEPVVEEPEVTEE
jgi:hypothetical protein